MDITRVHKTREQYLGINRKSELSKLRSAPSYYCDSIHSSKSSCTFELQQACILIPLRDTLH